MKIAFDIDDTLIIPSVATGLGENIPNYEVIAVYKWFQSQGHFMVVWSGSGLDWASRWSEKLGLKPDYICKKEKRPDIDIAFDDCDVDLGKVNIKVKRMNNEISRKEWNETKNSPSN